jgi:hypothetical protein
VEKDKGKSVDVRIRPDILDFILDPGDSYNNGKDETRSSPSRPAHPPGKKM